MRVLIKPTTGFYLGCIATHIGSEKYCFGWDILAQKYSLRQKYCFVWDILAQKYTLVFTLEFARARDVANSRYAFSLYL